MTHLVRATHTMVQYRVGHESLARDIQVLARETLGLFLSGNTYGGVGIPDCIHHAEMQAELIYQSIQQAAPFSTVKES